MSEFSILKGVTVVILVTFGKIVLLFSVYNIWKNYLTFHDSWIDIYKICQSVFFPSSVSHLITHSLYVYVFWSKLQWSTAHFTFFNMSYPNWDKVCSFSKFYRNIFHINTNPYCRYYIGFIVYTLSYSHCEKSKTLKPQSFQFPIKITGFFENTC